ncbi:ArnT family glycosyltransferase [Baaleninema sp.]|uniref:ArnT family glycosyltransferase n=1 Tax=Baaleninema sp. TaxID=3101197 RepID=UPI003D08E5A1
MLVVLPFLALALLVLIFRKRGNPWTDAVLSGALCWGAFVVVTTELFGAFQALTGVSLTLVWGLLDLLAGFYLSKYPPREMPKPSREQPSRFQWFLIGCSIAIVATLAAIALIAPPNNWDSMTYHMGRVVHWIQNRSVAHYPTAITRQIYQGPFAGFTITQLQILSGGDRFANLLQWLAMVGSLFGVAAIARELGASLRGQILAVVICVTIPMGILQSSSTQTDYVGAFWMVCFAYYVLRYWDNDRKISQIPQMGASLGLAILAKGTAYFYLFPFGLWFAISSIWRFRTRIWKPWVIMGAIALGLNLGHYSRNFAAFGSPLGATGTYDMGGWSLQLLLSNVSRNLALHLSTPVRKINLIIIGVVEQFHHLIGADASNPQTTFPPGQQFDLHSRVNHEDLAGNPLHLILGFLSAIAFFGNWKRFEWNQRLKLALYLGAIVFGFLMFCSLIIWSPWRSRLHLPLFVLLSPFIAVVLERVVKPQLANAVAVFLILASLLWLLFNETRPIIANGQYIEENRVVNIFNTPRNDQYFTPRPEIRQSYKQTVDWLAESGCTDIGLSYSGDAWEYPLWMLLKQRLDQPFRIEHLRLVEENPTQDLPYPNGEFTPCVIVANQNDDVQATELEWGGQTFTQAEKYGAIAVFPRSPFPVP